MIKEKGNLIHCVVLAPVALANYRQIYAYRGLSSVIFNLTLVSAKES